MKNGSTPEYYLVEGGLKLTRMRQSEWRRRWGIAGVVTFEEGIAAGADDAFCQHDIGWNTTASLIDAGHLTGNGIFDAFLRFDNVTVPAGATITAAYMRNVSDIVHGFDGAGVVTNLYMNNEDDAMMPTDCTTADAKARTTAFTAYDGFDFPDNTNFYDSPDFTAAVQEVVDRGGWTSGQAMMIIWDDDGSSDKFYSVESYEGDTSEASRLHIEYSA